MLARALLAPPHKVVQTGGNSPHPVDVGRNQTTDAFSGFRVSHATLAIKHVDKRAVECEEGIRTLLFSDLRPFECTRRIHGVIYFVRYFY